MSDPPYYPNELLGAYDQLMTGQVGLERWPPIEVGYTGEGLQVERSKLMENGGWCSV